MADHMGPMYELPWEERHIPFDDRKHAEIWPDGARMAVIFYITPEEWRWDQKEHLGIRGHRILDAPDRPSLSARTAVKYGFEMGLPRLFEIVEERGVSVSFPLGGLAAVQHPDIVQRYADAGHDIIAHSYSEGTPNTAMSRDEQREDIQETVSAIEEVTGITPSGHLGPGVLANEDTVELLLDEGFEYHCDLQDDDLPYFIDLDGETLVEVPYRMVGNVNDFYLFASRSSRFGIGQALNYLTSTFDAYYRAAAKRPLTLVYGTHPFVSGRPDSAYVFDEFLKHVQAHDDVWLTTHGDVAGHWEDRFGDGYPTFG